MPPALPDSAVPAVRIRTPHDRPVQQSGQFVLYWMIANRRVHANFSLQRAVDWARALKLPLVIFEPLRVAYPWASDRIHQFVIEGMQDNHRQLANRPVTYHPYLEPRPGEGKGALAALAKQAAVVVSDDFPCFFLPRMLQAAIQQIPVHLELVDSNGLYPMHATERVFSRAHDFRRHLQKTLTPHLAGFPLADPLARVKLARLESLPAGFLKKWPAASLENFRREPDDLAGFPIDHSVAPVTYHGGSKAALQQLQYFLAHGLPRYDEDRNQPGLRIASELSPWLHFGHISAHSVFQSVMEQAGWSPDRIAAKASGSNRGWWGAPAHVEAFLDELITWRELGYNLCSHSSDYDQYESLPEWARISLEKHASDRRSHLYTMEQFDQARTHDPLWNAAQNQLVREGRIHNYLRMLWGKKILEWTASPRDALATMIHLNNRYAMDGRNPNSYSGIFWVLGRYDRPWGPERPIYGKIRYMTSENTARKVNVKDYLRKYSSATR